MLGVSADSLASHARFRAKNELGFPLLSDPCGTVADSYGAWGVKKLYGKEYDGILRSTFVIGPDGRIERVYRDVQPKGHAVTVLADVDGSDRAKRPDRD